MAITFYDSQGTITSVIESSTAASAGVLHGSPINEYATFTVPPGGPATIFSRIVNANETLYLGSWSVWGDMDADYILKANGEVVGGIRTSPSRTAETVGYAAPIIVEGPTTLTIVGQHWSSSSEVLQSNIAGSININQ